MVRSSTDEVPESEAAAMSGAAGVAGAVVSIVMESAALETDRLPAMSVAVDVMLWGPDASAVPTVRDQFPAASAVIVPIKVAPS